MKRRRLSEIFKDIEKINKQRPSKEEIKELAEVFGEIYKNELEEEGNFQSPKVENLSKKLKNCKCLELQ